MTGHPNTTPGDVLEWQLTHVQAARYHARIADYYARRAQRLADLSTAYAAKSARLMKVSIALAVFAALLAIGDLL